MVIPPLPGSVEITGPDAQPGAAREAFFCCIPAGGDGEPFGDHDAAQIAPVNDAGCEQSVILVDILRAAIGGTGGEERGHSVPGRPTAWPWFGVAVRAELRQFRCVKTQQPDTIIAQPKTVAIARAAISGDRGRRWVQRSGDDRRQCQDGDGQDRAAPSTEDARSMLMPTQGFTAR